MRLASTLTFGLTAFTLALPHDQADSADTSNTLEKRSSHPWIASFYLPGCATHGALPFPTTDRKGKQEEDDYIDGSRPKLRKDVCVPWHAEVNPNPTFRAKFVGVNWGSGNLAADRISFFKSAKCDESETPHILHRNGTHSGGCYDIQNFGRIRSVRSSKNVFWTTDAGWDPHNGPI